MSLDRAECERVLAFCDMFLRTPNQQSHCGEEAVSDFARLLRQALAELDTTERDAERYRWLRTPRFGTRTAVGVPYKNQAGGRSVSMQILSEAKLDAAIDAAIEQTKEG